WYCGYAFFLCVSLIILSQLFELSCRFDRILQKFRVKIYYRSVATTDFFPF
uniref:Uncharacterized protein n=1 Tax=Aegilops tauschii subsp. strangulata TaxID=200361 RepID=A0A453NQD1_AEGTS